MNHEATVQTSLQLLFEELCWDSLAMRARVRGFLPSDRDRDPETWAWVKIKAPTHKVGKRSEYSGWWFYRTMYRGYFQKVFGI